MDEIKKFFEDRRERINSYSKTEFEKLSKKWLQVSLGEKYQYNFDWLGRPIIQYPNDILAIQEIIYKVKPDLIIETGIAHGGSLVLSASLLALLDYEDAYKAGNKIDPLKPTRKVVGVDIDIRSHNLKALDKHPLRKSMILMEGSSIDEENILDPIKKIAAGKNNILVCLDSNHTHEHVLEELRLYSEFVTKGSYCIVFDTVIEDIPDSLSLDRPWGKGNNPKTAVDEFLSSNNKFEIDYDIQNKLMITVAPGGYLRKK